MGRGALPAEFHGPRNFAEAVQTLDALEGEEVTFLVSGPESESHSTFEVTGTLRRLTTASPGHAFSLAGQPGFYMQREDFKRGWLSTHENTGIVHLTIELAHVKVEVGDSSLLADPSTLTFASG